MEQHPESRGVSDTPGLNPDFPIARQPAGGTLTCPNFDRTPNASYGYAYTFDATGGSWSKYWAGPYGRDVIPASHFDPAFSHYWLGAKLSQYRNASQKFLLVEHEYTSEVVGVKGANPIQLAEGTARAVRRPRPGPTPPAIWLSVIRSTEAPISSSSMDTSRSTM